MNLEIVNKILDLGKQTNEHLEAFLETQNKIYGITSSLSDEEKAELVQFVESNELLKALAARNMDIFKSLGWKIE